MFQMLTCFNLKPGVEVGDLTDALAVFTRHMREQGLCEGCGPVLDRCAEAHLDTDRERDHAHFFLMDFRDRAQSDDALKYIRRMGLRNVPEHVDVFTKVKDQVFICWQTA